MSRRPAHQALLIRATVMGVLLAISGGNSPAPAQPVPAGPDTLMARFTWRSGSDPAPVTLTVAPPLTRLGAVVAVVLEGEPRVDLPAAEDLLVDVDWLEPVPVSAELELQVAANLPASAAPRLVTAWRVYHLGPWQAAWADGPSGEVLMVAGQLDAAAPILPVRDPRSVGGLPRWLGWLLLAALLASLGLWLWSRRRRRAGPPLAADQPLPPPAWLQAALDLSSLERGESGAPTMGRDYLDRLAGILRRYLQDRFQLPAVEMTVAELGPAARQAGWPDHQLAGFLQLLATCDRLRYAPPEVTALHCRNCLGEVLESIERVRVEPVWSSVSPSQLAAASHAWQDLRSRHPSRLPARTGGA